MMQKDLLFPWRTVLSNVMLQAEVFEDAGACVRLAHALIVDRAQLQHRPAVRDTEREIEVLFDHQHGGPVPLEAAFDAGLTTFDCADIYTGVEALIGAFRARLSARRGAKAARALKVHTKLLPDLDCLRRISKSYVEGIVDESVRRLGVEQLDLVQFHWWDYGVPGAVNALVTR